MGLPASNVSSCPVCAADGSRKGIIHGEACYVCAKCGLWFYDEHVRNRPPTDAEWYSNAERTTPDYLNKCLHTMKPVFNRQIDTLETLTDQRSLLDIGCGLGLFLAAAASRNWHVFGVEKNSRAPRIASDAFGLKLNTDINQVPLNSVGVVRFSHVLEHVADPVAFLSAGAMRLSAGGVAIAIVPNVRPLSYSLVNSARRFIGNSGRVIAPLSPGHHILGFTRSSLSELFEKAGMDLIRVFDVSMGNRAFYPMFYDGLMTQQKFSDFDLRTLLRYWLPIWFDNIGNPIGRGQWIVGLFRKPSDTVQLSPRY